jgi:hypothetical protein
VIYLIGFKVERIFYNIYFRLQYHYVRIKEEISPRQHSGQDIDIMRLYLFLFGLSNALVVFMYLMNGVFREYVDKFLFFFLENIFVFSNKEEEHEKHLRMVLQVLREHEFYTKLRKWSFYQRKIHYLGHIILDEGISIGFEKIKEIKG